MESQQATEVIRDGHVTSRIDSKAKGKTELEHRQRQFHVRLTDPAFVMRLFDSRDGDSSFQLVNDPWILRSERSSVSKSGKLIFISDLPSGREIRDAQNGVWADELYERGCKLMKKGDRLKALDVFEQGLDLIPGHKRITKIMAAAEFSTTGKVSKKSPHSSALAGKVERSLHDALLERSLAGQGVFSDMTATGDDRYPMLPDPAGDRRQYRKKKTTEDRKMCSRYLKKGSDDREESHGHSQRKTKKRQRERGRSREKLRKTTRRVSSTESISSSSSLVEDNVSLPSGKQKDASRRSEDAPKASEDSLSDDTIDSLALLRRRRRKRQKI